MKPASPWISSTKNWAWMKPRERISWRTWMPRSSNRSKDLEWEAREEGSDITFGSHFLLNGGASISDIFIINVLLLLLLLLSLLLNLLNLLVKRKHTFSYYLFRPIKLIVRRSSGSWVIRRPPTCSPSIRRVRPTGATLTNWTGSCREDRKTTTLKSWTASNLFRSSEEP